MNYKFISPLLVIFLSPTVQGVQNKQAHIQDLPLPGHAVLSVT